MAAENWMAEAGPETIERVTAAIQSDPDFLRDAMANLNEAVAKHMGIDFPIKLAISVVGDVHYIHPVGGQLTVRDSDDDELSDDELEAVSAGSTPKCCTYNYGSDCQQSYT